LRPAEAFGAISSFHREKAQAFDIPWKHKVNKPLTASAGANRIDRTPPAPDLKNRSTRRSPAATAAWRALEGFTQVHC